MLQRLLKSIILAICILNSYSFVYAQDSSLKIKTIIFNDNFSTDSINSFPKHWNGNVKAVVETINAFSGNWLKLNSQGTYLPIIENPLPEVFTVEFDYIFYTNRSGNNSTELTFFDREEQSPFDVDFPGKQGVKIFFGDFIVSYLCYNNANILDKTAGENRSVTIEQQKVTKVRLDIAKELVTLRLNGILVLEIPRSPSNWNTFNTLRFNLWGSVAEPWIGNFMVYK